MSVSQIPANPSGKKKNAPTPRISIYNVTRNTLLASAAEVADRGATRRRGLLGRTELREGEGLWIVPCESVHTIGMRFAIDLVYLDRSRRVKKVRSRVPAWRMSACLLAHSVLELPAGTIERTETTAGDQILLAPPQA
jgi:uncharacterized membrane protein (UPF0127 family)